VRERIGELAVLKTVGFGDRFVLGLVLAESLVLALFGGIAGIGLAKLVVPAISNALPGFVFYLPPADLALGILLAAVVGFIAGLLPALAASRLRVVEALRRV